MERVVIESKVEKDNSVDTLMVKLIKESNRRLAEISEQTKNIDISDVDSYEKLLNLLKNLTHIAAFRPFKKNFAFFKK